MKKRKCAEVGILSFDREFPVSISENVLLKEIHLLNKKDDIDGILVQLPLPPHISTFKILEAVSPEKDVDGFNPINMGHLLLGENEFFYPCTPQGILVLLTQSGISLEGKHVVILGRSNIVGKPLAAMLMQKKPHCNATVTIAHSKSNNLASICRSADVLIVAIGKAQFVEENMVKPGAVVIDVGINRFSDSHQGNRIIGDVHFETVAPKCSFITPVPGGVGPHDNCHATFQYAAQLSKETPMIASFLYLAALIGNYSQEMYKHLDEGALAEYEKSKNLFFYKSIPYLILTGTLENFSQYPIVSIGQNPSHREIIAYHPDLSPILSEAYKKFTATFLPEKKNVDSRDELHKLFTHLIQFIQEELFITELCKDEHLLTFIERWTHSKKLSISDFTLNDSYHLLPIIPLDDFVEAGIGVCRHFALVSTYFIDRLCKDGYLSGKVFHVRDRVASKIRISGVHAWSFFISNDKNQIWHIDSFINALFDLNDAKDFDSLCEIYGETAIMNEKIRYIDCE